MVDLFSIGIWCDLKKNLILWHVHYYILLFLFMNNFPNHKMIFYNMIFNDYMVFHLWTDNNLLTNSITGKFSWSQFCLFLKLFLNLSMNIPFIFGLSCIPVVPILIVIQKYTGILCFIVLHKHCIVYKLKICGNPVSSKPISTIFQQLLLT